ncbi:MAG: D-alanyl-D-alanine carboxypeptidase/D-alanyl-D-alanine endopeptidase [Sphingosinicella sp.]
MATGRRTMLRAMLLALLFAAVPAAAQQPLAGQVEARLAQAGPGVRFGLVVAAEGGAEIVAIAPDARFIPGSNTKLFTTAAAFATLADLGAPDAAAGAAVWLQRGAGSRADVILEGRGDARLSSARDCLANCLAALADAVAAQTRAVRDVIGDDRHFPDERWSPGMSWNNIATRSGTAISALSLDDNELHLRVSPTVPGRAPALELLPYYRVDNRAVTVAAGGNTDLAFDRLPGSFAVRLTGTIAIGAQPALLRLGIDDPAHYAAWRLRTLLEQRGVRVTGAVRAEHRPLSPAGEAPALPGAPLARLAPPPLGEDLVLINKASQNVHAELLLRRLGRQQGTGAIADGLAIVRAMLERAGVARAHYDLSDGSGMSSSNRLSPRGVVRLLLWAAAQPWGAAFRSSLPVAGVDGTLASRFRGTALEGRLFAKTGTLNASHALSGYLVARSGRTLIFSAFANDVPEGAGATAALDAALLLIAGRN